MRTTEFVQFVEKFLDKVGNGPNKSCFLWRS